MVNSKIRFTWSSAPPVLLGIASADAPPAPLHLHYPPFT